MAYESGEMIDSKCTTTHIIIFFVRHYISLHSQASAGVLSEKELSKNRSVSTHTHIFLCNGEILYLDPVNGLLFVSHKYHLYRLPSTPVHESCSQMRE